MSKPADKRMKRTVKASVQPMGVNNGQSLGEGRFTALVSVFGNVDSYGEVVMPGAFKESLERWKASGDHIPVMWAHDWDDPFSHIGMVTDAYETDTGLMVDAQLDMSNPTAVQVFKLLKDRRVREFSYAGDESDFTVVDTPSGPVVQVGRIDLIEVSACLKGANPATVLGATKSDPARSEADTAEEETPPGDDTGDETREPDEDSRPFATQLTRDELRDLIREAIAETRRQADDDPGTGNESAASEPMSLPELTAWAADMETNLIKEEPMSYKTELKETLIRVKAIADKAKSEHREFTDEENDEIVALQRKADDLNAKIRKSDEAAVAMQKMLGDEEAPTATPGIAAAKTLGDAFVASDAYQAFKNAPIPDGTPVNIKPGKLTVKADPAPINTTLPGAVTPQMQPGYIDLTYPTPNVFLGLITRGATAASYVQYRQLVSMANNAATVAEGGVKPLSTLGTALAEAKVWTAADGVKVTNQELADDGIISTLINTMLQRNLESYLENIILNGKAQTDAGEATGNPNGILNTPGTLTQAFATDIFTTTRKAKTALGKLGVAIQAIVLNPEDNETIDLTKDANGRFFGQGPFAAGPNTLWGIPRIESQAVPVGTAIMGDFSTVQLLNREPRTVTAFNQNEDDARHNLTYVRAEERNLLFIREPKRLNIVKLAK